MRISTSSQAHTCRSIFQYAENQTHELSSSGSVILGQPTQVKSFVDRVFPLESITITRTRPTATITRADMEGRAGTPINPQDLVRYQDQYFL